MSNQTRSELEGVGGLAALDHSSGLSPDNVCLLKHGEVATGTIDENVCPAQFRSVSDMRLTVASPSKTAW